MEEVVLVEPMRSEPRDHTLSLHDLLGVNYPDWEREGGNLGRKSHEQKSSGMKEDLCSEI